ncbi:nose resistant to fluoxetine protein 6 [Ixodes scapularis]|uniref:nose resistant to fluoxetine protein 6 n=1 Tax=Ixodes scapularis TaxID=6945 RepID=UPI001C385AF9|nr:nose resistant to fluoxetine protein 6 [Ixodes scapularis]
MAEFRVLRFTNLLVIVWTLCVFLPESAMCDPEATAKPRLDVIAEVRKVVGKLLDDPSGSFTRKVLQADLSTTCSFGLIKLLRAVKRVDSWAFRLIDASGKYPTGMLQGTQADPGAFDECIETVVYDTYGQETARGQYCNLYIKPSADEAFIKYMKPVVDMSHKRVVEYVLNSINDTRIQGFRLGICFIAECSQADIQSLLDSVAGGVIDLQVKDCVTNEYPPISKTQIGIIAFLGSVLLLLCVSSGIDIYLKRRSVGKSQQRGALMTALTVYSVPANTSLMMAVSHDRTSEAYAYRFLHGIRFIAMFSVVLGHSYSAFDFLNISRLVNALHMGDTLGGCVIMFGYLGVDAFFFVSGFLLTYNIRRQKGSRLYIGVLAIFRRFLRANVVVFFVLMCYHLVPLIASGPNLKPIMEKFYYEFSNQWWRLLIQIRNFSKEQEIGCFGHLWYLSCEFQLFLISLIVLLVLKRSTRLTIAAFVALSIGGSTVNAWQVYNTHYGAFLTPLSTSFGTFIDTLNDVYPLPSYHGVCYFTGCITVFLVERFQHSKLSKLVQLSLWCLAATCCLSSLFMKYDWNRGTNPTQQWIKIPLCYTDRFMWSFCLMWSVFAIATGRGGFFGRFLSWQAFIPISRLSFGIYVIHVPFYFTMFNIARERIFYSHFTLIMQCFSVFVASTILSYVTFVSCEVPVGRLEKLVLGRFGGKSAPNQVKSQNGRLHTVESLKSSSPYPGNIKDGKEENNNAEEKKEISRL